MLNRERAAALDSKASSMAGLLSAEAELSLGRPEDCAATLDVFQGTLDDPVEAAYAAYIAALATAAGDGSAEQAVSAVEAAVQALLDTLQVCISRLSPSLSAR